MVLLSWLVLSCRLIAGISQRKGVRQARVRMQSGDGIGDIDQEIGRRRLQVGPDLRDRRPFTEPVEGSV